MACRCWPHPSRSAPRGFEGTALAPSAWDLLDFSVTEDHYFVYSYNGATGADYSATATGDLDCDGTTVDYVINGTAVAGNPSTTLTKPARGD